MPSIDGSSGSSGQKRQGQGQGQGPLRRLNPESVAMVNYLLK